MTPTFTVIHHTSQTDTMVEGTVINEKHVKFGLPSSLPNTTQDTTLKQADQ